MYLIHAGLRAPSADDQLPPLTAEFIRVLAGADGPVEHVSVHRHAQPDPVVGVYVLTDSLDEAELHTEELLRRALDDVPALRGWSVTRVGAPLVAPFYENLLLSSSGPAGRNGPGPLPST
ncbi:hypothetical protein [Streptomyces sp. G-G2]|uniref:hypothetical protein n=1 Tax=Streptomyces sp. G-G2 TaxID=3046201 RepID=UPI0024B9BA97|nr:hypothetical protein [Streptomyces sp. G-G2]MDJ0380423.1 hypothetical protein [Streptomyces sp. G-G2]